MQNSYNIISEGYSLNELSKLTDIQLGTWKNRAKSDLDTLVVIQDGKVETVLIVNDAKALFERYGEVTDEIETCKRKGYLASRLPSIEQLITDLRENKSKLQRDISGVTQQLKQCNGTITELQKQYDSNVALLQQRNDTIAELQQQLNDTVAELKGVRTSDTSKDSQVSNLRGNLNDAKSKIAELEVLHRDEKAKMQSEFSEKLANANAKKKQFAKWIVSRMRLKYEDQRTAKEQLSDKHLSWVLTALTFVTVAVTVVSCMSMFGVRDLYHGFMGGAVSCAFILTAIANSMIQQSNTTNIKKGASGALMVMMGCAAYYMHHNTFSQVFKDDANGWFAVGLATFFILMEIASIWFRRK